MGILALAVIVGFLAFGVIRTLLGLVLKRFTAHWLAFGLSTAYFLGLLIYGFLAPHRVFIEAFRSGQPIFGDFAGAGLVALIPLNFLVLPAMYWWDKRSATNNKPGSARIPENALHGLALCGGLIGAYIGQKVFNHKTSKQSFQTKHFVICAVSVTAYLYIGYRVFIR